MSDQTSGTIRTSIEQNKAARDAFVREVAADGFKFTADRRAQHTGHVVVEFERRYGQHVKPSGISTAKQTAWVVQFGRRRVMLPTDEVRTLVKHAEREGLTDWTGDGGASHIAKLPLAWLVGSEQPATTTPRPLPLFDAAIGRQHDRGAR
jgi:hypothetical protein